MRRTGSSCFNLKQARVMMSVADSSCCSWNGTEGGRRGADGSHDVIYECTVRRSFVCVSMYSFYGTDDGEEEYDEEDDEEYEEEEIEL